jgi:hypothetical protein
MLKDSPAFKVKPSLGMFGNAAVAAFLKNLNFFLKKKKLIWFVCFGLF